MRRALGFGVWGLAFLALYRNGPDLRDCGGDKVPLGGLGPRGLLGFRVWGLGFRVEGSVCLISLFGSLKI